MFNLFNNRRAKFEKSCELSARATLATIKGNSDEAFELYQQAILACPENPLPYWNVIALLHGKKKDDKAFDLFEKEEKLDSQIYFEFKDSAYFSQAMPDLAMVRPAVVGMFIVLDKIDLAKAMLILELKRLHDTEIDRRFDYSVFRSSLGSEMLRLSFDNSKKLLKLLEEITLNGHMSEKEWRILYSELIDNMVLKACCRIPDDELPERLELLDYILNLEIKSRLKSRDELVELRKNTQDKILQIGQKNKVALENKVIISSKIGIGNKNETYLFFDTETTGLPRNWNAPVNDLNNWPRLVQIAWILCDKNGNYLEEKSYIIKPEGFRIPADVSGIHGITTERAEREGESLEEILIKFNNLIEQSTYLVAHNMSFDEKIVGAEFLRKDMLNSLVSKKRICTKEGSTNFCAIPSPNGFNDCKWPKLSELYMKLFGIRFNETHDALSDVRATVECFWEMKKRGIL